MYRKLALAAALLAVGSVTASAAEFYIVHDKSAKRCVIVEKKPTVDTMVVVGNTVYATRAEAETALKTVTVCSN